jgi:hypothetical protein
MSLRYGAWACAVAALAAALGFAVAPQAVSQSSQAADCADRGKLTGQDVRDVNADCKDLVEAKKRAAAVPKTTAPIDMTGFWVAVVTEDWRWRMALPAKGDYASLPLHDEGVRVANQWDPARDANNCKEYGAAGLLRNPLRVEVKWLDDKTMELRTDHGEQTRTFHFDANAAQSDAPSMQGDSIAIWDGDALKVVTRNLSPGYVRRNGVPYDEKTVLTEYFNRYNTFGTEWLTVTTIVNDPTYYSREFITSSHFKKLPDGSSWHPVPCGQS